MSFGVLALLVFAGLAGPALAASRRVLLPVVVGEIAAGVVIGRTGFSWIDPAEPTTKFLGQIGFAMLMFEAGMRVPLRHPGLAGGLRRGAVAAALVALLSPPAGFAVSWVTGEHDTAIYALLVASGSAAVLLPALEEHRLLSDSRALTLMAQVALADVGAVVALPLVLQPSRAGSAALGGLAVAVAALGVFGVARLLDGRGWVVELRKQSKHRAWALDLRLSLLVLFTLAWIAVRSGTSTLVAGFAVGLVVAAIGGPKRLSRQVTGLGAAFFVPLFFVVLGAQLDLRALWRQPSNLALLGALLAANLLLHLVAARITGQPVAAGLAATAQMGIPAAAVALGLDRHSITGGQAAAIIGAALLTLCFVSVGVARLTPAATAADRATS
jgi:Kef-type K+ transport system membrane component KefB